MVSKHEQYGVQKMILDDYNTPTYKITKKTIEQFSSIDFPE